MSVVVLRLLKQAGCFGAVLLSAQPRNVRAPPEKSQVAATATAFWTQAGALMRLLSRSLPEDEVTTAPRATKLLSAAAMACV